MFRTKLIRPRHIKKKKFSKFRYNLIRVKKLFFCKVLTHPVEKSKNTLIFTLLQMEDAKTLGYTKYLLLYCTLFFLSHSNGGIKVNKITFLFSAISIFTNISFFSCSLYLPWPLQLPNNWYSNSFSLDSANLSVSRL